MLNRAKDIFLYAIVGGIATVAEWVIFYFADKYLHYAPAVIVAYLLSTLVNWGAGRLLMFREKSMGLAAEIGSIYLTAVGGLGLNLLIMWVLVSGIGLHDMVSKVIATGLVFLYNYFVRRKWIYRDSPGNRQAEDEM